ncbi:MAG TPA: hypothetical protein VKQ36_11290 [Ktedonobacterales bacterium]|nr:hypothetical protein [Ktedonobacterales bacterium]
MLFWLRRWGRGSRARAVSLAGMVALCLALQACGSGNPAPPSVPGGVYKSVTYHFQVRYPAGWQANATTANTSAPLILTITQTNVRSAQGALISIFTLEVLSLKDPTVRKSANQLASDKTLTHITLAGLPAYRDTPLTQQSPGAQASVTHTDYYLLHGAYEYQISTDALKGEEATLQSIVNSFTIVS